METGEGEGGGGVLIMHLLGWMIIGIALVGLLLSRRAVSERNTLIEWIGLMLMGVSLLATPFLPLRVTGMLALILFGIGILWQRGEGSMRGG